MTAGNIISSGTSSILFRVDGAALGAMVGIGIW